MPLNLRARVFARHLGAVGIILGLAAVGGDWIFSRMVLGEFDESLRELAQSEAAAAIARPTLPPRIHEVSFGTAPPSFPRLDKFIQVVALDGRPVARSVNLGNAQLPAPVPLLARIRSGEEVFETIKDFGDEPVRERIRGAYGRGGRHPRGFGPGLPAHAGCLGRLHPRRPSLAR